MSEEQAVVEQPETPAKPIVEDGDAQDLDALLAEYKPPGESQDKPETKDVKPDVLQKLSEKVDFLEGEARKAIEESAAKAFDSTVKSIKGDLPIPEKWIKAFLNEEARNRPGLREAYIQRERDPGKWQKIEGALRKELSDDFAALPSKDATSIANQVESAVRNAKPQTPNLVPKNINTMSDNEFEKTVNAMAKAHAG